jgi:hypothetical protein
MPEGTQRILNARALQTTPRHLAALLRPGLTGLDLGCGTGAMTRDIAAAVAPADHLTHMCAQARLVEIIETPQLEITQRTDPDVVVRLGLWAEVAATRGRQMVADEIITELQRAAAETEYRVWLQDHAESQCLYLMAVEGTRP